MMVGLGFLPFLHGHMRVVVVVLVGRVEGMEDLGVKPLFHGLVAARVVLVLVLGVPMMILGNP